MIQLVEKGSDKFYTHLRIKDQTERAELHWINQQWRFRPFAYQGDWVTLAHPLELEHLFDRRDLGLHLTDFLLMELYYYKVFEVINQEFRKKIIENLFGISRCEEYCQQMDLFEEALVSSLSPELKPKPPALKIIK